MRAEADNNPSILPPQIELEKIENDDIEQHWRRVTLPVGKLSAVSFILWALS